MLLYASATWLMREENVRRLSVFDNRCLRSLARVNWKQHVSNTSVRHMVSSKRCCRSIDQVINLSQLRWLSHVLCMHSYRLPRRALFVEPLLTHNKRSRGQTMTRDKNFNLPLNQVHHCRLSRWGPHNQPHMWLNSLSDMTCLRSRWRSCFHYLVL